MLINGHVQVVGHRICTNTIFIQIQDDTRAMLLNFKVCPEEYRFIFGKSIIFGSSTTWTELMTSRSWLDISCHWGACSNHSTISDLFCPFFCSDKLQINIQNSSFIIMSYIQSNLHYIFFTKCNKHLKARKPIGQSVTILGTAPSDDIMGCTNAHLRYKDVINWRGR